MSEHKLNRVTFKTSREMDFFSKKELVTQTGHEVGEWPLVIVKELVDNALDACEDADVLPAVEVVADESGITVKDNGPGLPEDTLKGALDFSVRVSNREAYVSPCRGAQGNALKTLIPMPLVVDPEHGKLIITTHGKRHTIRCGADPISQRAVINDDVEDVPEKVNSARDGEVEKACFGTGTTVRLEWAPTRKKLSHLPNELAVWPFDGVLPDRRDGLFRARFRELVEGYAIFNPHASISLDWFGERTTWPATEATWQKWQPCKPTSAHWYERRHLERLIAANITHDRDAGSDRLVSDLIEEFDGLSGSAKRTKVLDRAGLKRVKLSELVVNDRLDGGRIATLLAAMQEFTKPVKPSRLGVIGEANLKARLLSMGVVEPSFKYSRRVAKEGLPWVLESAFGWLGKTAKDQRRIYTGANWSSAIKNPFRSFGSTGEGLETVLANMRATSKEPIIFVLHLAHPRVEYTDRGKSALIMADGESKLSDEGDE